MVKVRRALISVWEKKGVLELARKLAEYKVEIISTGKTASLLRASSIPVKEVSSVTSFPEILSGRVKTLHPKIFGGILANKKHPLHMEEIKSLSIEPIDMVVVNLYPFLSKLNEKLTFDDMMEYIDIGGVSLLRAAAKNFKNVASVSAPSQYKMLIEELDKNKGDICDETLKALAQEAFYTTKEYDNSIYNYFASKEVLTLDLEKIANLRYGENPHQRGALYKLAKAQEIKYKQIQGKELSYNNLLDLDTAVSVVRDFAECAVSIVKHASICGVGVDKRLSQAYKKAYVCDPISSFGGIVGINRKVDKDTAEQFMKSDFKECVIAPSYSKEALKVFSAKKNLRVLEADFHQKLNYKDIRATSFGFLLQDRDTVNIEKTNLKIVTRKKPTQQELKDMMLAWKIAKYVRSNAIVLVKNQTVLGLGGGQPSRVGAAKIALGMAKKSCHGAVLASDGFFPKEDAIKIAYKKGIRAIIQPGGSIKDNDLIKLCDKLRISMVFTGIRHFRH
ncbi:MAG: bifunctional phosphoribosylaminoimidazolecarboxamide formyltransferase/IMP cyclohydrolase [Candidatus Omnitrophica bacterium]|jgi:phosphoribosylaminoimidazolecarboxamide formyltransferase/IMP cyclohydrolase|nr:bifunctional phosphoribosylaminoimidazolecarboxamide formyltransferase/IMP cyclohydrolase [Candidatus Omnitrophota bacterium]